MAKIRSFTFRATAAQAHPTEVDATWSVIGSGPDALVQISTYGSDDRQSHPKVSQTIQVDARVAGQLVDLLVDTYGSAILRR